MSEQPPPAPSPASPDPVPPATAQPSVAESAELSAEQQRTWAIAAHVIAGAAMILSVGTLGFVAALVIYLVYKDRGAFVRQYSANAVNIQLNALLWAILGFILAIVLVGFLVLAIVPVWATILHLLAAIKASDGQAYWSPWTIRFVR